MVTGKTHLAIATVRALMEANPNEFGARNDDTSSLYDPDRKDYRGLYCSFFLSGRTAGHVEAGK